MKHSRSMHIAVLLCVAAFAMAASLCVRADELHLKDGKTIEGTIVGYQGKSFRVKTSYGFALVERSSVISITVTPGAAKHTENEAPPVKGPEAAKLNANASNSTSAVAKEDAAPRDANAADPKAPGRGQTQTRSGQQNSSANASSSVTEPRIAANQPSNKPAPGAPAPQTLPVQEEVQGNLYINQTYGFQMYKPPDWELIAGARAALPGAIVALGTSDEKTYLIVGLEPPGGTLESHLAGTNERLANSFENFRASAPRIVMIAGAHGYEYQFHGATSRENATTAPDEAADSQNSPDASFQPWTGIVILLQRGSQFFSFFGVTSSNSDLVQIQQNVIQRTVWSLQFTK